MRQRLVGVKPTITFFGETCDYIGTEVEDKYGRFEDSYQSREGFHLIHEGPHHHVYKERPDSELSVNRLNKKLFMR